MFINMLNFIIILNFKLIFTNILDFQQDLEKKYYTTGMEICKNNTAINGGTKSKRC